MNRSILVTLLSIAAACGGGSSMSGSSTPIVDPIPMIEARPEPAADPVVVAEPAPSEPPAAPAAPDPATVKAELLATETTAYDRAKPVFEKHCAGCHSKGQKGAKAKPLGHLDITTYPFGGHHATEVGTTVRTALGIGGGKPTMPKGKAGAVAGDELALVAAWADAFDAAHAGGAHEGRVPGHDHPGPAAPTATKPAQPKPTQPKPAAAIRIQIAVTRAGFEPKNVDVPRGKPVILRFERQIERTCGTEVVMVVDGKKIVKDLPLNTPVELALTFRTAGVVKYSCAMDMIRGTITVQ